jgi:AcrR family transcriptional regulator
MAPANRAGVSRSTPAPTARRQATRAKILAAAEEVLAERGFHGASVEDICERASFTRGAFYSNFASKDELVVDLLDQHTRAVLARIAALADQPALTLEEVLESVFAIVNERPAQRRRWHLLSAEFALHALRDPAAGRVWAAQQASVRHELGRLVEQIVADRGLRLAIPTDDFVVAAVAIVNAGATGRLLGGRPRPSGVEQTVLPRLVAAATEPLA